MCIDNMFQVIFNQNKFSKLFSEAKIFFLNVWKILERHFGGEGNVANWNAEKCLERSYEQYPVHVKSNVFVEAQVEPYTSHRDSLRARAAQNLSQLSLYDYRKSLCNIFLKPRSSCSSSPGLPEWWVPCNWTLKWHAAGQNQLSPIHSKRMEQGG